MHLNLTSTTGIAQGYSIAAVGIVLEIVVIFTIEVETKNILNKR